MWGFLLGTLALAVAQTLVQPGSADKVASGSGVLADMLSRLLSEQRPGIRRTKAAAAAAAPPGNLNDLYQQWIRSLTPPGGPAGSPGPGSGSGPAVPPPGGPAGNPGPGSGSGPG